MAQCRTAKIKEALRKPSNLKTKGDNTCDKASEESSEDSKAEFPLNQRRRPVTKGLKKSRSSSLVYLRPSNKPDHPESPDVDSSEAPATTHSKMKTKQPKDDTDKSLEDDTITEPKTRARKKASDTPDEDKTKPSQDEPKTSKEPKKTLNKPKAVVKKRPLGIRKTLRNKKVIVAKDKIKNVIKQGGAKRGRKPAIKVEPPAVEKETVPLIPAEEIKKELVEEPAQTPNSRSSSPRTAGRRNRLSSDMIMMKSLLADSPTSQVTRPYSMRSERSNSPSLIETKNLRSGKPRKVKSNLLNEVVMKEQKKRRRLMSDSKPSDSPELNEDAKKLKRGRSCSRDGSEISKCSDITESDISLSEALSNDAETKELNKKLDKPKTDLDVDIENNLQTLTTAKVPFLNADSKTELKTETESASNLNVKNKKKLSLKRSTSIDSDNNNSSNRLMLETINNTLDIEDKANLLLRTDQENDTLFDSRSSILTSMSKTFNSKEVSKNIRKARRGRKSAASPRAHPPSKPATSTITNDSLDDKHETLETLSKEIDDLISNLDQTLDNENNMEADNPTPANTPTDPMTKPVSKFYGLSKPLCDNNSIISSPETPLKDKEVVLTTESTPSKTDDSENIRLHYEDDSVDKSVESNKLEVGYKCSTVASIDKLMDRLKEFEEFDKKRQRQESESKGTDSKQVMVTNDVVLIPKSGAEIKPLKDIQSVRSPEKPLEKENFLSCFENNSAISILKRDHARKSLDLDLPNSVTLIKRNSISRKESTGSNHSRESTDAISIFEKSLGKDVTLTEIRKSADKASLNTQVDLHQFATLHPNNSSQNLTGHNLDSKQISITPRVVEAKSSDIMKQPSRDSNSRKSSESAADAEVEKMATIEKIKSPVPSIMSPPILSPEPVAVKSPTILPPQPIPVKSPTIQAPVPTAIKSAEIQPMETEPLAPPLENVKAIPEDITMATKVPEVAIDTTVTAPIEKVSVPTENVPVTPVEEKVPVTSVEEEVPATLVEEKVPTTPEKMEVEEKPEVTPEKVPEKTASPEKTEVEPEIKAEEPKEEIKEEAEKDSKISESAETAKPGKSPEKLSKVTRKSLENLPGPSNLLLETPESQKRKENVLRTLGLLTHKAAKEAKIEKSKERERLYGGLNKNRAPKSGDYTGTLKTVIKLNRSSGDRERKKYRSSLKITFQKSKNRSGKPSLEQGQANDEDDAYYTIERREAAAISDGVHRKSYSNRLNSHDPEAVPEVAEPVKEPTLNLVIPEKASSFSIHPDRLCMDQCFYCGGKFGLFDTPCHIAQMKSAERQKKVLDNEEKLTIDSCLCDACYRHVDRRANCPSYRKRPPLKYVSIPTALPPQPQQQTDKPPSPTEEESEEETRAVGSAACHTAGCGAAAERAIRRKWLIKMRASVNKVLKLEGDYPGLHTIPLCAAHYRLLAPLLQCALCRRRLTKHHAVHTLHHGFLELNPLLQEALIPVQFTERPVLCKQCRYYCLVLQQPSRTTRADAKTYRRRLLQIHNVELPPESENETEETSLQEDGAANSLKKKKTKVKNKQRKSTSPDQPDDIKDRADRTSESSQESDKVKEETHDPLKPTQHLEEDIESLISSNKIMVPGAKNTEQTIPQSDGSEPDPQTDTDGPAIPLDKQTELQYLLQKQNNPAQFMKPGVNLTQKQRNILKVQTITSGIQKPGQIHRVHEKNTKRIQKLGQIITQNDRIEGPPQDTEMQDANSAQDTQLLKNLNEECTIESIPNKRPADITVLKNKWEMSGSSTQVKKNLSELSKKLTIEKAPSKKISDLKYSNPVKRLETNPSISVRELFPGEEELPLQCNIEFNSVKGVTPEGWEKCNSTVQYDVETKRLWTELQRPYGNQSSFLRHLVLLEKYFRSGDLVLSQQASPHAANYSDSVQSRLRAYDNVVTDAPRRCEPSISLIEYRKQKPAVNGKSLLKTNQHSEQKKTFMPPPGSLPKSKTKEAKKTKQLPPELIAINTPNAQGRKAIQNVLHNIQQLVKGVSASDPTEVAAAPLLPPSLPTMPSLPTLPTLPVLPTLPKLDAPAQPNPPPKEKKEVKSDTPKKQKTTSKPWRPTLMPITQENLAKIAREPPQTAVDGRTLPSLVQVMSSGKRYHITLQDYNKMCIMRREKLQQLQDGEPKTKRPSTETTELITEIHPNVILGNGGTMTQSIVTERVDKKDRDDMNQMGNAATILKNVGLKNITIAPIPAKTATVTSHTLPAPMVSSPSLLVTSTPIKLPHLGSSVSITSETVLTPTQHLPLATTSMSMTPIMMPKIPRSLTVIPQTIIPNLPQGITTTVTSVMPSQAVIHPAGDGPRP